jgi:hypothetical protein
MRAPLSRIVRATLWRSPVQLEGLPSRRRLAMGVSLGGPPPALPAVVSLGSRGAWLGGCPASRLGLRPVGDAGWALWAAGRWLDLPPSIWG